MLRSSPEGTVYAVGILRNKKKFCLKKWLEWKEKDKQGRLGVSVG